MRRATTGGRLRRTRPSDSHARSGVPRARRKRPAVSAYAAPAAFILAVTIAVLLIRSGLNAGSNGETTTGQGTTTHPSTVSTAPTTGKTRTATGSAQYYTVQSGDTFGSISAKTGVPVSQLEE